MNAVIHSALIVFVLLMVVAFSVYAYFNRGRLLLGIGALVVYAIGAGAVIGAGLTDGFFVPLFAARYAALAPALQNDAVPVLTAAALAIQVMTKFGFAAFAGAALLWSIELMQRTGRARISGAVAGLSALAEVALIALSGTLTPRNLPSIAFVQAVWCLVFAAQLWDG
jgi:hypothetical protein